MSRYPYTDRMPCIVAAGKPSGDPCENIKDVFQHISFQDKVDTIRKQLGYIDAKNYGLDWVKVPDAGSCEHFTEVGACLRKPTPTFLEAINEELKSTFYDSYWNKALGKTRDPRPGLPAGMNPLGVVFGKKTITSEPAGGIVNPPKKAEQIVAEDKYYHDIYAFTHNDYYPGEQIRIGYTAPFNAYSCFGDPTNKDESGARIKKTLRWFNNDPLSHVSRRQAAVRNRTLPPLGKALDKTGVTDLFPEDHTFGEPTSSDFYGVEDLLNECTPSLVRRDTLQFLAYANNIRQKVSEKIKSGEIVLEELYEEILKPYKDEVKSKCSVRFDHIDYILKKHKLHIDIKKIEPLLLMVGILSEDGEIEVKDFIKFIDKNSPFPELKKEQYISPPEFQEYSKQYRSEFDNQKDKAREVFMPRAGIPTIRLDTRRPVYWGSLVNMDNLGEETTARTLISPSIFTQYGLSHRDFFKPRSKEFLQYLFSKINVTLSPETFEELYQEGCELDQTGGVCVETFRNLLDIRAYKAYNRL